MNIEPENFLALNNRGAKNPDLGMVFVVEISLFDSHSFGNSCCVLTFIRWQCLCSANDLCKESRRQTINADDVLKAIEEIEFPEFVQPLKASLDGTKFPYV